MEMTQSLTPLAQAINLAYLPHPILSTERVVQPAAWRSGYTVRNYLRDAGFDAHREIVIRINGRLLTVAEWDTVCPAPGDQVAAEGVVSGDDDNSAVRIVLMIAVVVIAAYTGVYVGGAEGLGMGTAWGAAASAGVTVAGNLIISATFRPSLSNNSLTGVGAQPSPTYSLSGGSNRMRPYEPLAIVLGTHRAFPDYAQKPYTEFEGDDQYLYQVFNFGLGNLALSDLRIGETPLTDYQGVTVTRADNGRLPGFSGNVDTTEGGALTNVAGSSPAANWVTRTTGTQTTRIALDFGGTFYQAADDGSLVVRSASVEVQYAIKDSGAWQNFGPEEELGLTHYWSRGYWAVSPTEEYWVTTYNEWGGVESRTLVPATTAYGQWTQVEYDEDLSQSAHSEGASGGDYTVDSSRWDVIVSKPTIWRWVPVGTDAHPVSPYTVGSNQITFSGKSAKPLRKTVSKTVASGQYDVRVRRISPDETETRCQSTVGWLVLRSYQDGVADYTGQTVIGLKIKATGQLNGAVAQFSAVATQSTRVWANGAWTVQPTTNPAWWYLDFATGLRNAAGQLIYGSGLDDAQIDIAAIKAWAVFCDANALTFAMVLDRAQTAADALSTIARCGFASPSWAAGKLGVVWDAPNQAPTMAFGMANIAKGSFEVSYLSDGLADEIVVSYTNRNNNWQPDQVRVTVPGTTGLPTHPSTLELLGCTTNAMAAKFANAMAAQQLYRRRMVKWETDFEGFVCQRGDVVILSHDLTQWGYSGRLAGVSGTGGRTISLGRSVPRSGSVEHLMIRAPDGSTQEFTLAAGTGETETLTLPSDIVLQNGYAAIDHLWFFSPLATPGKRVKIVSVQPLSESRVRLIATDEGPEIYAAWGGVFTEPPPVTTPGGETVSANALTLTLHRLVVDGFQRNRVSATWLQSGATESCRVRAWLDGVLTGSWASVIDRTLDIEVGASGGVLSVEVTPMGKGRDGAAISASLALSALPAPNPPALSVTGGLFCVNCAWTFGDTRQDIQATEIWFASTNDRAVATRLSSEPFPATHYSQIGLSPGAGGYYWARVIDTRANPSLWFPASATAGLHATASTDPSNLLTQLQGALGLQQLANELAHPITLVPDLTSQIQSAAQTALALLLKADSLKRGAQFEHWVTSATTTTNPASGTVQLLATATVTTDVEAHLNQVDITLNAVQGSITSHTQSLSSINGNISVLDTEITQLQGQIALTTSAAYLDSAVAASLASLTPDSTTAIGLLNALLSADNARKATQLQGVHLAGTQLKFDSMADATKAEANERLVLAAAVNGNLATIVQTQQAQATATQAVATSVSTLAVTVGQNAAAIVTEQQARSDAVSAIATSVTTLGAVVEDNRSSLWTSLQAVATDNSATATAVTQVQARLNSGDYAAVKEESSATASAVNGLLAKWSLRVDVNGHVVGISLNNDGSAGSFIILADKFLIAKPDGTGAKQLLDIGTVNGVNTLGFSGDAIFDGTVVARHLAADTINATNGQSVISDLSVSRLKITGMIQGSVLVPGQGSATVNHNSGRFVVVIPYSSDFGVVILAMDENSFTLASTASGGGYANYIYF